MLAKASHALNNKHSSSFPRLLPVFRHIPRSIPRILLLSVPMLLHEFVSQRWVCLQKTVNPQPIEGLCVITVDDVVSHILLSYSNSLVLSSMVKEHLDIPQQLYRSLLSAGQRVKELELEH